MKILSVLTYYRPHTSGLTIYAERLAEAWARKGHEVTVLTSRFDRQLPEIEVKEGVKIIRAPVLFRVSKGVIMPTFGLLASKLVVENDFIQLHLPQFDAAGIALRGRLLKKPTVVTYHCDLRMPKGLLNLAANVGINLMNNMTGLFTHRFVTYTQDYAVHSPFLKKYLHKLQVIPPPVILPRRSQVEIDQFRQQNNPQTRFPIIGMATRFATEKGVEVLLGALPEIISKYPQTTVWFAGAYERIMGEEQYFHRLSPQIRNYQQRGQWHFLGNLSPEEMAAFYPNLNVLVVPSLNSTEAFGLVQIEAMLNGVPAVASDLPGVRQPVLQHKMGKVVPIGDSGALAKAVIEVLQGPGDSSPDIQNLAAKYDPDTIAEAYEHLFLETRESLLG